MTPAEVAIARRAVACKGWRWMPGMVMRWQDRARGVLGQQVRPDWQRVSEDVDTDAQVAAALRALPDLTDPATLGCLLALVREAWRCDRYRVLTVEPSGAGWAPILRNARHRPPSRARGSWDIDRAHQRGEPLWIQEVSTEAEALVAALEAAP